MYFELLFGVEEGGISMGVSLTTTTLYSLHSGENDFFAETKIVLKVYSFIFLYGTLNTIMLDTRFSDTVTSLFHTTFTILFCGQSRVLSLLTFTCPLLVTVTNLFNGDSHKSFP